MATLELTKENFDETIVNNDIVLIDFWAPWCAPCRSFAPIYEQTSENHTDIVFGKVNTEEEQELAATYRIRSIPTLMLLREQILLYAQPGMLSVAQLEQIVTQARELDMDKIREEIEKEQQKSGKSA
jgi:thioredoxin 1